VTRPVVLWILITCAALVGASCGPSQSSRAETAGSRARLQKRWLFIWRDMADPKEVDRMIARFPRAQADGYNGVVFAYDVAREKAADLKRAAAAHGLDLIAVVMGVPHDRNLVEGVAAREALFVAKGTTATFVPEGPGLVNGDFEEAEGNHFVGWPGQIGEGVTTFADRQVAHTGRISLRVETANKSWFRPARLVQPLNIQPHRQYRISFWLKTEGLVVADPEARVLTPDGQRTVSFQTFRVEHTQDWTHYDLVFNSLEVSHAELSIGTSWQSAGRMWWDDVKVEEIALVNVLRRPGCPVGVRGEEGTVYEEGRDYDRIVDPNLDPWTAYHASLAITLPRGTRIRNGERLRVSYYHPIIVGQDRVNECLSEQGVFEAWRAEVVQANTRFHPAAFLMSHDELHVVKQCALCRSMGLTPGQLLAWNVRQAVQIIRDVRPDAGIWVWSDMFDPTHNAVDRYFAVNGSLRGSWEGLDPDVGVVNWHGAVQGRNARFFADRDLHQILAGYYDSDEDGAEIATWLSRTARIPGIVGAMYTTWEDRYDAMDAWAKRAWGRGDVR
jgi:hypothetical protein